MRSRAFLLNWGFLILMATPSVGAMYQTTCEGVTDGQAYTLLFDDNNRIFIVQTDRALVPYEVLGIEKNEHYVTVHGVTRARAQFLARFINPIMGNTEERQKLKEIMRSFNPRTGDAVEDKCGIVGDSH